MQPIHTAAQYGQEEMVAFLINNGASIAATNERKEQPPHYASKYSHLSIIQLLLRRGADINVKSDDKSTPLTVLQKREE